MFLVTETQISPNPATNCLFFVRNKEGLESTKTYEQDRQVRLFALSKDLTFVLCVSDASLNPLDVFPIAKIG